jgi:hypothetical protein
MFNFQPKNERLCSTRKEVAREATQIEPDEGFVNEIGLLEELLVRPRGIEPLFAP